MQIRAGNKAIRDHSKDGKALHLFEQEKKGYVQYKGEFALSSYKYREGVDKDKRPRRTIVFHLVPVSPEKESREDGRERLTRSGIDLSAEALEALRRRAYAAASEVPETNTRDGKRRYYERSADVRDYVLARSKGLCEACSKLGSLLRVTTEHHTSNLTTLISFQKAGLTIHVGSVQYVLIATERFITGVKGVRLIVNFKSGSFLSKRKRKRRVLERPWSKRVVG